MLTTLSVLLLCARRYYVAHVGDTRVYLYRRGTMNKLTADHVWQGKLGLRLLRRAVGLDARVIVDFVDEELAPGDLFLMLTDGVWEVLSEPEIAESLASGEVPSARPKRWSITPSCAAATWNRMTRPRPWFGSTR